MSKSGQSVLSLPAQWKGHQPAGAGLNNLGNSCYLNSTLQCLAYIPPLAHLCLTAGHSAACGRGSSGSSSAGPCAFCLLERTLCSLLCGQRGAAVSPGEVIRQLHLFGRSFVRGRQEDSHEFLTALLDVAERDARRAAVARGAPKGCRTIVEDLFVGCWQSQVRCLSCGHESNTYESFATLPLDIGQARTVAEGLAAFTEAERLDGSNKYKCDRCRQLVPAIKQTTIWDDPNVLVLHLKRFDGSGLLGKVSRHVSFPETLDLSPFMTPPAARRRAEAQHAQALQAQQARDDSASNGHHHDHHHSHHGVGRHEEHHHSHRHHHGHHQSDQRNLDDERRVYGPQLPDNDQRPNGNGTHHHGHHHDPHRHHHSHHEPPSTLSHGAGAGPAAAAMADVGPSVYRLTGVLVHQGSSLHSGHYYALVRDSADHWSVMNDSQVYGTSLAEVRQEQAYLLFYTRQSMKLPRPAPVLPPPPTPAPAEPKERKDEPAVGLQRRMIGPQLPPGIVRLKAAAAAAAGSGTAAAAAGPLPRADGLPGPRPAPARPGVATAVPSARLPARPAAAGAASAPLIGPPRPPARAAPEGPAGHPPAAAAAAAAAPPGEQQASSAGRKRKLDEVDAADAGGGEAAADADGGPHAALEAEVRALQAGASWREGVKRLKTQISELVRESSWMGAARGAVERLRAAGLSLPEVLATGDQNEARRALTRAVPKEAMLLGFEELRRMLQGVLVAFGWVVSGLLPSAGMGVVPLL